MGRHRGQSCTSYDGCAKMQALSGWVTYEKTYDGPAPSPTEAPTFETPYYESLGEGFCTGVEKEDMKYVHAWGRYGQNGYLTGHLPVDHCQQLCTNYREGCEGYYFRQMTGSFNCVLVKKKPLGEGPKPFWGPTCSERQGSPPCECVAKRYPSE